MEVKEAEQPKQELPGFNMEQADAEFIVAQSEEMTKQMAILESIQDEAYEGDVHEHQGLGHDQAALMGLEAGNHHDQHLLPMPSGGGGGFGAPPMLDDDSWYFDAVGDAAGNGSMIPAPATVEASGSSSGFGDASQMFPLLDVPGFDLDISGDLSAFLGAGNAPNASLLPHGNTDFLGSFGGFGTAPAQTTDFGDLAGFDLFDTEDGGRKRKAAEPDIILDDADDDIISIDASGLNYDSEDGRGVEESGRKDGNESNANSTVTGGAAAEGNGKKKGMPAKNLLAERRRRKKLNDRLYALRSVVPRISKMDRASILGDAIEYLKELKQKINVLQNELEASPSASSLPPTPTSIHPLAPTTPTMPALPSRVKEELTSSPAQEPCVEVKLREGRAVNIRMMCSRRPGVVHSSLKALEGLGLDVQQAVISYFNDFTLDVFKQCKDGPGPQAEEIKAVLLKSAGFQPAA
ncbi:unnamed protein product [Triticum turgidum subsp. durum]|uniref:BHLH domain-containing protein n=1 Tax=Triticum turgidum subsp. durum TaxID=4567 RepID=A0A9R0W341_TRITD|nr:unnamed protein product [Triticum turgidum subsp. durum]